MGAESKRGYYYRHLKMNANHCAQVFEQNAPFNKQRVDGQSYSWTNMNIFIISGGCSLLKGPHREKL